MNIGRGSQSSRFAENTNVSRGKYSQVSDIYPNPNKAEKWKVQRVNRTSIFKRHALKLLWMQFVQGFCCSRTKVVPDHYKLNFAQVAAPE
jgi:hypothetical protein